MKTIKNISYPMNLPICAAKAEIIQAIIDNQVIVIAGDTGSGKTTQLPKMCLEAGRGKSRLIGCTQPRRLAATSVAERVREELGDQGHMVGYKIRFRNQTGPSTRIKFMTDGILLAEAQNDRYLRDYDTIIIDEAHERSLNIDFLLGMLKKLLLKRHDLKIIITSATIDTEKFSKAFNGAPVITVTGRTFPVEIRYAAEEVEESESTGEEDSSYVDRTVDAVLGLCRHQGGGDMLVFLPTERDIRECVDILGKRFRNEGQRLQIKESEPVILPLFGRLSGSDQQRIFKKTSSRKIVVCTNVAETSVTVPGIRFVVDSGLARISSYNVRARTTKLPVTSISRASCDQRAGRCGRVGPGICVRLYSEENYLGRPEYTPPEIVRSNLAEVILNMIALRLGNPKKFPFIDPPSPRAINDGYNLLGELGAISKEKQLTGTGRVMALLPLDPRISRMIITARENNCLREVVIIAAALSIQDPRVRPADSAQQADEAHGKFNSPRSDFLSFLNLWDKYDLLISLKKSKSALRKFCQKNFLAYQRMREWRDIHEQIWSQLATAGSSRKHHYFLKSSCRMVGDEVDSYAKGYDDIHKAILSGNLRNIGLKKEKNFYLGGQGKELMLFPGSGQFNKGSQWMMAAELVETSRLYARTVAGIKAEWIEPLAGDLCRCNYSSPHWQKKQGKVVALEKVTLFGLVIVAGRQVNFGRIKPAEARQIFIQSALVEGDLGGNFVFFEKNSKLIDRLSDIEDRMRRRDILVDDFLLYEFYDKRLPADVFDRASLIRLLKQHPADYLVMQESDILRQLPGDESLADYPQNAHCGELTFPLSYSFQPGTEDDGVTVKIPVALLGHVASEKFEWLVPGLLLEKIVFLLKGLPKSLRRQLIPIPRTAEEILEHLKPFEGSLYQQLEDVILRKFRLKVARDTWPRKNLPPHLKMRFQIVDNKGSLVDQSRDFNQFAALPSASEQPFLDDLRCQWERNAVSDWDFEGLPDRIAVKDKKGRLTGFAFPGLSVDKDDESVALRLFSSEQEKNEKTRIGLRVLYSLKISKQCKALRKDLLIPRSFWALYEGISSHEELNDDLYDFVLTELFSCAEGSIPARKDFENRLLTLKAQGLHQPAMEMKSQVIELLRDRRQVLDAIADVEGKLSLKNKLGVSREDCLFFRKEVGGLLPPRFLLHLSIEDLQRIPRYLKAIRIRLERKTHNPGKDAIKEEQLTLQKKRLEQCLTLQHLSAAHEKIIKEFRYMIEEFKVSLFAQELKTAFPVSEQRLERKWMELKKEIDNL